MPTSCSATRNAVPDFDRLAGTYDALRPRDANWWELFELLVREGGLAGRRVLEIGCGTGTLAEALDERGARVWGVDPSEEMLAVARGRVPARVALRNARAEQLPFKDGWFERAVARLVVHLVDRPRAFAELARVLAADGRAAVATFDPTHFERFWLNGLFPSLAEIDHARFPTGDELERELRGAGFASVRFRRLSQRTTLSRERALERIRGRYISTLRLLPEDEYAAGLERAERELPNDVSFAIEWLVAIADRAPAD